MQSGRLNPMQLQQRNEQIFRVAPSSAAPVAGRVQQQAGAGVSPARSDSQSDSEVYREGPADPVPGRGSAAAGYRNAAGASRTDAAEAARTADAGSNAGPAATASVPVHRKAPDNYEKPLKVNFNEENLLSGIVMAEVLGRPKCLRRGRW